MGPSKLVLRADELRQRFGVRSPGDGQRLRHQVLIQGRKDFHQLTFWKLAREDEITDLVVWPRWLCRK